MVIKVLGTGCTNCKKLKMLANAVIQELDIEGEVVEVTDIPTIMGYGVTATPGLVIDEKLIGYGGVPSKAQLTSLVQQAA
jgi:small redox-active disulfide protein 2